MKFVGKNTREYWQEKHKQQYDIDKIYDNNAIASSPFSYHFIAGEIIKENKESVKNKSILEIGCAGGNFLYYVKTMIAKEFYCEGWDFSPSAIKANKERTDLVEFKEVDILLNPVKENYGFICCFETIEHLEEGENYKVLNNLLDHCEYLLLSTVDTVDDCFGEHISHYTFNTFEEKGYNVIWKTKLSKIDMSGVGDFGDYHYIMFLLEGKVK